MCINWNNNSINLNNDTIIFNSSCANSKNKNVNLNNDNPHWNDTSIEFFKDLPKEIFSDEIAPLLGLKEVYQFAQLNKKCRELATNVQKQFAENRGLEVSEEQTLQVVVREHISSLLERLEEIQGTDKFKEINIATLPDLKNFATPLTFDQVRFLEQCVLCDTINSYPQEQIPMDIEPLIRQKKLLSVNDLVKLRKYIEARDIIIFWYAINQKVKGSMPFDPTNKYFWSLTQYVQKRAADFTQWCNVYQAYLKNMPELVLLEDQLTNLPEEIGYLTNLKRLYLQNNRLTHLPKAIGNLTNLGLLYLQNNRLIHLPKEIGNFKALWKLDLSNNALTSLPPEMSNLTGLELIFLDGNKDLKLPQGFQWPPNLTKIPNIPIKKK